MPARELPCSGLSVVELASGVSDLGMGLAGGVPGMILGGFGAKVTRVVDDPPMPIDRELPWPNVWHRDKTLVAAGEDEVVARLLSTADVVFAYGPEAEVEARARGYADIGAVNPAVVYARCRPSRTALGPVPDFGLLVEATSGFCTQLAGHRPGPIFIDVRATGSGTAFLLTASVLALLHRRANTGSGGWAETSLYDGMLATLGCMIGRSERASADIEGYWEKGSTFPNFLYRCADGQLIQVWFGGKGMYAKLLEVLGDEPSAEGYYTDQITGALIERARRWRSFFATRPRDDWVSLLRDAGVACEPLLGPGEVLTEPHLLETGLAVRRREGGHEDLLIAPPIEVRPLVPAPPGAGTASGAGTAPGAGAAPAPRTRPDHPGLLHGVHVLDFSAFVAGPLAAQVLADLGAEVIKVEPLEGEAMRAAAYAVAACQRGKRSLALDIGAPDARPVVERLIRWADVVLHNFRVGVAERLEIDQTAVARINPNAVYCHASAFGSRGPRAKSPGNDALMQAVTGLERALGGAGNDPIAATWIPLDMAGGWIAALGILAGLYARATGRCGQQVATSLLGAGLLLQSGVYVRDGALVRGPELDAQQTGYGPGYRIYEGGDGRWFALVVPDPDAWARLRSLPGAAGLPETYVPLRIGPDAPVATHAEDVLAKLFAGAPAAAWVERLDGLGIPVELIRPMDRDAFRRGILDDPVNRELGRVTAFETADWGHFEQIGPLLRCGPDPGPRGPQMLPQIGEHTVEVLDELGFTQAETTRLLDAKVVRR